MLPNINRLILVALLAACNAKSELQQWGAHYQQYTDYTSLQKVVELLPANATEKQVKNILGLPNDMGFEYRYTVDSVGINGCTIGAVFQFNDKGEITQKWIGQICE